MGTPKIANRRASRRILKPVIEKKRRDRINQRLDELRTLLLDKTLDSRLQNPKLEKAEILELTVDYIRKKASNSKENIDSNRDSSDLVAPVHPSGRPHLPRIILHDPVQIPTSQPQSQLHPQSQPQSQPQSLANPLYTAGFRECISRLASFIECVEPAQRESFVQGLHHHLDSHSSAISQLRVPSHPWVPGTEVHCRTDVAPVASLRGATETYSYPNGLYPQAFVLHHPHHATTQTLSHPYPSPPYSLSPPPSPCYSTASPPFSTSPTYLSMPCHFPFPPSLSPPSSDSCSSSCSSSTISSSFTASTPALTMLSAPQPQQQHPHITGNAAIAHTGPPTPARPSGPSLPSCNPRTLRRALFQNQTQLVWRPW